MPKVNLGRIRTVFKGEWVPGTYVIDDVVLYAGSAYTCIAIAALSNNPTDTSFWVKSAGGIEFAGVWDTATTYKVNQIVTFNGATYIAITAHSATEPTTSGQTDWITMSGGLKFEGAWNIGTTYQINDLVTFNGTAFISISNHTGTQPEPAGNAAWAVFAGGFQFEGVWNSGIAYQTNDLVTFNGSSYIAISDHTGTQPEPAGNAAWIVFASGLQFEGAWDTSTAYHVNDITILNGSSYIAISDHTGTQPEPAGNAAWVLFASGGDIADQTGNAGKVLSTDGTSTSWANVGVTELGITDGSSGDYLSTDGAGTLSFATPSSGGEQDFELLGSCYTNSQWSGYVCIPPEKRGMFTRYMVKGVSCCHTNYCSSLAMRFAGANTQSVGQIKTTNDCNCNTQATYCCAHDACGSVNQWKCNNGSEVWACAGMIPWINGCSSGCATACANYGYAWEFNLYPFNPCWYDADARRGRFFNRRDGGVGGDSQDCCGFFHNVGRITPCCGGHSGCMQAMCWSNQSASASYGKGSIQIFGMGRITKAQTNGDGTSWVKPAGPGDRNF